MCSLFANGLIVNGELVHSRDMHRDLRSDSPHPYDEDSLDDFNSDVAEISDSENEADIFRKTRSPFQFDHMPSKTSMNEVEDSPPSKGKEKEHETTSPTPEPQVHNLTHGIPGGKELLRFLIGSQLDMGYRGTPYERPGIRLRGPATYHEDSGDAEFVPHKRQRRRDMFPSHFMPSIRAPRRKPLPEFVIGPSRITLDDLY